MDHDHDHDHADRSRRATSRDDAGMTLIELLITTVVLGIIVTVIAAAVVVTIRQQPVTRSRLDVAAWEQSLALWLPADLSSAGARPGDVDADAAATPPCADPMCSFGSNALQLKWDDGTGETVVTYRYGPAADGNSFELRRVVCESGSCRSHVVLRDLAVPSDDDGNPIAWASGDAVPDTVINVTVPLSVGSGNPSSCDPSAVPPDPDCDTNTRAQRVIVNVNGAPGLDGVDRSSTVSFTAGGSALGELEAATFSGPSFLQANSGCGGPITLIVDESNSLSYGYSGSDIDRVQEGVNSFIDAFEGTPTKLQIITFGTRAATVGTSGWNRFYDLADPSEVAEIRSDILDSSENGILGGDGGTNWEDALFRTYFASDGDLYDEDGDPTTYEPELVVFFTDGEPTLGRHSYYTGDYSTTVLPESPPSRFDYNTAGNAGYGADYSPRSWWRASYIVDLFDDIRLIGVGVGSAFNQDRRVWRSGWPNWWIDKEVFLGDLVTSGDPSKDGTAASGAYVKREWSSSTGWGDVTNADLLVTTDWSKFGSALTEIALAECGGTLTVQTRDGSGQPADASITYTVDDKQVTTTRIVKAATFDIALNGVPSDTVDLVPQSFDGTGYTPASWNCRAGGANLTQGSDWDLITPGVPGDGITITVDANQAVACTLNVSP